MVSQSDADRRERAEAALRRSRRDALDIRCGYCGAPPNRGCSSAGGVSVVPHIRRVVNRRYSTRVPHAADDEGAE